MTEEYSPLGTSAQWPEGRGFLRLYSGNPVAAARLAQHLIGFRELMLMESGESDAEIMAIDTVLRRLTRSFPSVLEMSAEVDPEFGGGRYEADPRLSRLLTEIIDVSVLRSNG